MEYITFERFKGKDLQGNPILITRGKKLTRKGDVLFFQDKPICIYRSECAKRHFNINDDSNGLARGDLISKIAFSQAGLNDAQAEIIYSKWDRFLNKEHDVIIFNDSFFETNLGEIQELYSELEGRLL